MVLSVDSPAIMAYSIPGVFIIIGSVILLHASMMPQYTNPGWESAVKTPRWGDSANDTEKMAREWYDARLKVVTSRDRDHDIGLAILLMGVSIAGLFGIKRLWRIGSIGRITSPRTRWGFCVMAAVTWISFAFAMAMDDGMRFDRGEVPLWAEPSPTENLLVLIFAVVTLPFIVLGVLVAVWSTPLPVELASGRPMRNVTIEVLILGAIMLDMYVLYIGFTEEAWVTAPAVVTMYLLLCGRAAANHPQWVGRFSTSGKI